MKVILLQDVAKIGQKYEVKEVPAGHALNYLIPKKIAEAATPKAIERLKERKEKAAEARESSVALFNEAVDALHDKTIQVTAQANEQGHLFKAVSAKDIAEALREAGSSISEEAVVLSGPIKEVGVHEITLAHGEVQKTISITVAAKA